MPRAVTCMLDGVETSIERAIDLNDEAKRRGSPRPDFRCADCGMGVKPHKAGGHASAHFEHFNRNDACPLSDPERK